MSGLLAYSGLTTKIRALEGRFLTDQQFREMAALEKVTDAVDYLKRHPAYEEIFSKTEDSQLHRGTIEQLLSLSEYKDFTKLYRFSNISGRKFLNLYFMHYEIAILKKCLRNALENREFHLDLTPFQDFFKKHSKLDFMKLSASENLQEFISALEGSPYYDLLTNLSDTSKPNLFDFEMHLDLMYFKTMWKTKRKLLSRKEQTAMLQCFGSKLDMLNIQWIYRSKKYYQLSSADIYSLLIPIRYHLKKEDITAMATAQTVEEFYAALQHTFYGSLALTSLDGTPDLEFLYEQVLNRVHRITRQRNPYSVATLNSYLYVKGVELHKIITVIECIRYGIPADTICSYIMKN